MMPAGSTPRNITALASAASTSALSGCGYHADTHKPWNPKTRVVRSSSTGKRPSSSERTPRRSLDPCSGLHKTKQGRYEREDVVSVKPSHHRRVVVLGAPRVGKTAIVRRFLGEEGFQEQYEPTSEEFHSKLFHIRGESYQLDILDASKERDFPARRRLTILTGDIFLLVFSVTDSESFSEVCALRQEILSAKAKLRKTKENRHPPIIICANKTDLEPRKVHPPQIRQHLGEDSILFEVSAKDCANLEAMFEALALEGGLPTETRPSLHRDISISTYQALSSRKPNKRGVNEPCGAVHPLARRPSFESDLRRVMGPSTPKKPTPIERCQIQ